MTKFKKKAFSFCNIKLVLLFFFSLTTSIITSTLASNNPIDSLQNVLKKAPIDTQYVLTSIRLASYLTNQDQNDKAIALIQKNISIAKELNFENGIANSYLLLGNVYLIENNYTEAIKSYSLSIEYFNQIGNIAMIANLYKNIGLVYSKQGKYSEALKYYFVTLKTHEKIANKAGIANTNKSIGVVYFSLENYKLALQYFRQSLKINEELKNEAQISQDYNNIANVLSVEGKYDEALLLYNKSLLIKKKLNDKKGIATTLDNIATIYYEQKNYTKALEFYVTALHTYEESNNELEQAKLFTKIGNVYTSLKDIKNAKININKGIKKLREIGSIDDLKGGYQMLSQADSTEGNYEDAYLNFKIYSMYKDSVFNDETAYKINELQIEYDTQKKEQEIVELKQKQEINNLKLKQRNYALISLALLVVLTLLSILFFVRQQKQKRKLAIQQTQENERKRMAKDIHDDLGSGLSKIIFMSNIITNKMPNNPEILSSVTSISNTSTHLVENMRDLIWALDNNNLTIASLAAQIREYSYKYFDETEIKLEINIPIHLPEKNIRALAYRNIYFIAKEALQNILKHSNTNSVQINFNIEHNELFLKITDNGKGMSTENLKGNGLKNMQHRAKAIDAIFTLNTTNSGTSIEVKTTIQKILL